MRSLLVGLALVPALATLVATTASAAPARLITAPPVTKGPNPNTGPTIDPLASQGQWFQRPTGLQEVRPYEFYDNIPGEGGGGASTNAIMGHIVNAQLGAGGALVGFDVVATITNDLPGQGIGQPGRNSHGESLIPPTASTVFGTMYNVKMTAEFAMPQNVPAGTLQQIVNNVAPYSAPPARINSKNEDQLGWYCFTPNAGALGGDYLVPTWDFGNIAPGASATRTLSFSTNIAPTDPYFAFLTGLANAPDVLLNRTTDLKIGDWVDSLQADTGVAYSSAVLNSGNVSVFFNVPEPTTLSLVAGLVVQSLRRRR